MGFISKTKEGFKKAQKAYGEYEKKASERQNKVIQKEKQKEALLRQKARTAKVASQLREQQQKRREAMYPGLYKSQFAGSSLGGGAPGSMFESSYFGGGQKAVRKPVRKKTKKKKSSRSGYVIVKGKAYPIG